MITVEVIQMAVKANHDISLGLGQYIKVTIIKSRRKTIAIQVNSDLSVTVRAPYGVTEKYIEEFLFLSLF